MHAALAPLRWVTWHVTRHVGVGCGSCMASGLRSALGPSTTIEPLRSSMRLIGIVPVICSYMTGWGSQGTGGSQRRQSWTDQHIWLPGVSVSVVHRCRSLLLSFSICYLGILGLEGAINCILAPTSHQRTTSEKRTKALLPKCPLFGGSTVFRVSKLLYINFGISMHSNKVYGWGLRQPPFGTMWSAKF